MTQDFSVLLVFLPFALLVVICRFSPLRQVLTPKTHRESATLGHQSGNLTPVF
jgi:hypothetical protein